MDAVEDIKQRLGIEDVVSEYIELKRAGRNWKGLSPFSNERTPSFMVSPEKQIWHDFSSGKGGSMFSFVMEMEGVDFKGALEILARKAGIDLEQYRGTRAGAHGKQKERMYEVLELAAKFYQAQLKHNREALEYLLKSRAFTKETILEWRLGYSPNTGSALTSFLKSKQVSEADIQAAGLSTKGSRRGGDMFRGRIMVPLADPQGRIIGFTARLLADIPDAPKYINTPQTLLYDKSRHVFGLHLAKDAIRRQGYAVVAEGNLDVISSHQAGVRQVVATAGTALTEAHLKALSRFSGDIRLSFDADRAGLQATERAIPIASKVDVSLSVITISSGKDPDELIRQDSGAWQHIITEPRYALDWLIEYHRSQLDLTAAQDKRRFSDIVLAVVRQLRDPVEQEHYMRKIGELIGVSQEALRQKLASQKGPVKQALKTPAVDPSASSDIMAGYRKIQGHLLSLLLLQPELRSSLQGMPEEMMVGDEPRKLAAYLSVHPEATRPDDPQLQSIGDYVKVLLLQYEELYGDVDVSELRYEATRLRTKLIEQYVKMKKQRLAAQFQSATENETQRLLEEVKQLDELLRNPHGR